MTSRTVSSVNGQRPISRGQLVFMLASMMAINALAVDAMLPALSVMADELHEGLGNRRQLVVGLYLLGNGIGSIFPGILADRFGRRPVVLVSLAAYFLLALGCGAATNFTVLLTLRAMQGVCCAGLSVVPAAIVRDRYHGDEMARLMSMISAVFIMVPMFAPSIGQLVLSFAGWRWIFVLLASVAAMLAVWVAMRLPETLAPSHRQNVHVKTLARNMRQVALNRGSIGYVLASAVLFGAIFGYINMSQQLIGEFFDASDQFALVFAFTASTMVIGSLTNSRIVMRFGARRVSHTGLIVFILVSAAQVWLAYSPYETLWRFASLMAINIGLLGFLGANFGSIAMQPFAEIAGAASSLQSFLRMVISSSLGILIGFSYDHSARPLAIALLASALASMALVLWAERGVLFKRLHKHPPPQSADHVP